MYGHTNQSPPPSPPPPQKKNNKHNKKYMNKMPQPLLLGLGR